MRTPKRPCLRRLVFACRRSLGHPHKVEPSRLLLPRQGPTALLERALQLFLGARHAAQVVKRLAQHPRHLEVGSHLHTVHVHSRAVPVGTLSCGESLQQHALGSCRLPQRAMVVAGVAAEQPPRLPQSHEAEHGDAPSSPRARAVPKLFILVIWSSSLALVQAYPRANGRTLNEVSA
eukprot:scaffold57831_cov72-Phaeocystis_antarctica.AAC.3